MSETQAAMEAAALAVATLDPDKWAGWVAYLLEALDCETLDGRVSVADYQTMLETVSRDIATRLELGRW